MPAALLVSLLTALPGVAPTASAAIGDVGLLPAAGQFMPLPGTKVLDSRDGTGVVNPGLTPGSTLTFSVRSVSGTTTGVPADATAVVLEFNVQANFSGAVSTGADTSSTDTSVTFPANTERNGFDIVTPASDGTVVLTIKGFSPIPSGAVMSELVVRLHGYYTGASTTTAGSTYVGFDPALLADTNGGSTVITLNGAATTGALTIGTPAGASGPNPYAVQVTGNAGVPADGSATAVALQVNVQNPTCTGGFSLVPGGSSRTDWDGAFSTGENDENFDLVQLPSSGQLTLRLLGCSGTAQVVIRVRGYYSAPTFSTPGASFTPTTRKVFDTTTGTGTTNCATTSSSPQLAPHTGCAVQVLGTGSIPANGVSGVAAQVVAVNPTNDGWLGLYRDSTVSQTSTLSYSPGGRTSNFEVASYTSVNPDGTVYIYNGGSYPVDVIIRVHGYYRAPQAPTAPPTITRVAPDAYSPSTTAIVSIALPTSGDGGAALTDWAVTATPSGSTTAVFGAEAGTAAPSVAVDNLSPSTTYTIAVAAVNGVGTGPSVTVAYTTASSDPQPPTSRTVTGPVTGTVSGVAKLSDGTAAAGQSVVVYVIDPNVGDTEPNGQIQQPVGQATTAADGSYAVPISVDATTANTAMAGGSSLNVLVHVSGGADANPLQGAQVATLQVDTAHATNGTYTAQVSSDSVDGTSSTASTPALQTSVDSVSTVDSMTNADGSFNNEADPTPTQGDATDATGSTTESVTHTYPSHPCATSNVGYYHVTYNTAVYYVNLPLGEVHTGTDSHADYFYSSQGETTVGTGVRVEGKAWTVNFGYETNNTTGIATTHSFPNGYKGDVDATYKWGDYRFYDCFYTTVKDYTDLRHPYGSHPYTGNLRAGYSKTANDTYPNYVAAHKIGHGLNYDPVNKVHYHYNLGYKYSWEASVLGLTVGAKTAWLTSNNVTCYTGHDRYHRYWGNDDDPFYASITYTDGGT